MDNSQSATPSSESSSEQLSQSDSVDSKRKVNPRLYQFLVAFVGISGAFSVLFGAWLAHGGQTLPSDVFAKLTYAHHYQFFHTLALFIVTLWYGKFPVTLVKLSALGFVIGILLFSGTLYLKVLFGMEVLSKLTPIGGVTLALAWFSVAVVSVINLGEK